MPTVDALAVRDEIHTAKVPGKVIHLPRAASAWPSVHDRRTLRDHAMPRRGLPDEVNEWRARNWRNVARGYTALAAARKLGVVHTYGALFLDVHRQDAVIPYGLASLELVVNSGLNYLADTWTNTRETENIKYVGVGTGTTTPAGGDTDLQSALSTALAGGTTRPTASSITRSGAVVSIVATNTCTHVATAAVTEAGLFTYPLTSDSPNAADKVLFDHFVFSVVNLGNDDGITTTMQITFGAS